MSSHPRIYDRIAEQTKENALDACSVVSGKIVQRPLKEVVAATLHQTACYFPVVKYQIAAAKGDTVLAYYNRLMAVNAHAVAGRYGKTCLNYKITDYVNHGHQLNGTSWGFEHEGLFDADGKPIKPPSDYVLGDVIEAGRAGLTWLAENAPNLKFVWAHRQAFRHSKGAKVRDPGPIIFKEVGVEHGVKKLGLTIEPDRIWGYGKPLPKNWYT